MIAWTEIQAAIKTWAGTYSGLTAVWLNEAQGWVGKAYVSLQITNSSGVGIDEARYEENLAAELGYEQEPTFSGVRQFVLSVRLTSRDQSPDQTARHYLEVLRTSLKRPSVQAMFSAAGFSVAQILAAINQDRRFADRWESVGLMDILCNTVSNVSGVTAPNEATGQLESVQLTSTLSGAIAVDDMIDEILP